MPNMLFEVLIFSAKSVYHVATNLQLYTWRKVDDYSRNSRIRNLYSHVSDINRTARHFFRNSQARTHSPLSYIFNADVLDHLSEVLLISDLAPRLNYLLYPLS